MSTLKLWFFLGRLAACFNVYYGIAANQRVTLLT